MPHSGWVAGQCAWNGPSSGFFVSVGTAASLKASGDVAAPNAKTKLAQFKKQAGAGTTTKVVTGIGDGAVLTATGLAAYKGGTYLQFTNLGLTEPADQDREAGSLDSKVSEPAGTYDQMDTQTRSRDDPLVLGGAKASAGARQRRGSVGVALLA